MLNEAMLLFVFAKNLSNVTSDQWEGFSLKWLMVIGHLIPLVVVGASAVLFPHGYDDKMWVHLFCFFNFRYVFFVQMLSEYGNWFTWHFSTCFLYYCRSKYQHRSDFHAHLAHHLYLHRTSIKLTRIHLNPYVSFLFAVKCDRHPDHHHDTHEKRELGCGPGCHLVLQPPAGGVHLPDPPSPQSRGQI